MGSQALTDAKFGSTGPERGPFRRPRRTLAPLRACALAAGYL